jgi:hypothetical protein
MRHRLGSRSLTQQAIDLRRRFPDGEVRLTAARLNWLGTIQPTPMSREYRVEVTLRTDRVPQVRVLEELDGRPGESLPHVYREGTLCLHRAGEWEPLMFIADSTLVWTAEWLFNYEIWKATGNWHGGGESPAGRGFELGASGSENIPRDDLS